MITPRELAAWCDRLLDSARFADHAPNGLQVEGTRPIRRLVSGVTASAALLAAALESEADALLVHHGWFWKNDPPGLTGIRAQRARTLLASGMSLLAYHLPLDAHPELGNNAALGRQLGILNARAAESGNGLLWTGELPEPLAPGDLADHVAARLERAPLLIDGGPTRVRRIAWCSGGGQGHLEQAAGLGVEAFLSGEISEQTTHLARECGIVYLAAGHHATERYGIAALGRHLAEHPGIEHRFIDIDNPA